MGERAIKTSKSWSGSPGRNRTSPTITTATSAAFAAATAAGMCDLSLIPTLSECPGVYVTSSPARFAAINGECASASVLMPAGSSGRSQHRRQTNGGTTNNYKQAGSGTELQGPGGGGENERQQQTKTRAQWRWFLMIRFWTALAPA